MSLESYVSRILAIPQALKENIVQPIDVNSLVRTRYITSEGNDDINWIGALRDETRISDEYPSGVVDIWMITFSGLQGLPREQSGMIGGFDKPISIYLDYYADYRQGLDYDDSDMSDIKTNSEREFLAKVIALDFKLEAVGSNDIPCLTNGVEIQSYDIRLSIKQFSTNSCHRASCVLNLLVTGNIL